MTQQFPWDARTAFPGFFLDEFEQGTRVATHLWRQNPCFDKERRSLGVIPYYRTWKATRRPLPPQPPVAEPVRLPWHRRVDPAHLWWGIAVVAVVVFADVAAVLGTDASVAGLIVWTVLVAICAPFLVTLVGVLAGNAYEVYNTFMDWLARNLARRTPR